MENSLSSDANGTSGQYRRATVLFADLSGYKALLGSVGAAPANLDAVRRIIRALEDIAYRVVSGRLGILNEVRGDGIVALFGLREPGRAEFDVCDAVEAALEIQHEMAQLPATFVPKGFHPLQMHCGIDSGLVSIFRVTRDKRIYQVIGTPMVVAHALEDRAASGEILVSSVSASALAGRFLTCDRGTVAIEPIGAIEVAAISGRVSTERPLKSRLRRSLSPFFGRENALATLEDALQAALGGRLQTVWVSGIGGVGKTRLIDEFILRSYPSNAAVLRGICSGLGHATPFQSFLQILHQLHGPDAAWPNAPTAIVDSIVASAPHLVVHAEALRDLLGVDVAASRHSIDEEASLAIVAALVAVLKVRASVQPMILFLDDWQWADESSAQVLVAIRKSCGQAAMLIVVAMRDAAPKDPRVDSEQCVELSGLSEEEAQSAVHAISRERIELGSFDGIFRASGGVPLYIEELCQGDGSNRLDVLGRNINPLAC